MDGRRIRRWINRGALTVAAPLVFVMYVPQALAFPYHQRCGSTEVWSDAPVSAGLPAVLSRADALVAASPLAGGDTTRKLFLTDGGWRWRLLARVDHDSFGLRRPLSSALLFNRSDLGRDRIFNGSGERSLSGVIAHETGHLLVARRIGEIDAVRLPTWVSEGLADFVAQESRLSDAEAAQVRRIDPGNRALSYYDARRRVARTLAAKGGSLERLLTEAR